MEVLHRTFAFFNEFSDDVFLKATDYFYFLKLSCKNADTENASCKLGQSNEGIVAGTACKGFTLKNCKRLHQLVKDLLLSSVYRSTQKV